MNIKRLNINNGGVPSTGFSGREALVRELEALVECKFPKIYLEFLRIANGGHPEVGSFNLESTERIEPEYEISRFYGIDDSVEENLKSAVLNWQSVLGKYNIPIGRDGGGNQIYLNLSDDIPSVWIYMHDNNNKRLKVSSSFETFINSLQSNADFI